MEQCKDCEWKPFVASLSEPNYCPEGFVVAAHFAGYVKRCAPCARAECEKWYKNAKLFNERLEAAQLIIQQAYSERNALVCVLSKLWPSHLCEHPVDPKWDKEWLWVVCIHSPVGQLSWHIHISELENFAHLKRKANDWDGHTTEEKYKRLAELQPSITIQWLAGVGPCTCSDCPYMK